MVQPLYSSLMVCGTSIPSYASAIEAYAKQMEEEVLQKVEVLDGLGWDKFVSEKLKK